MLGSEFIQQFAQKGLVSWEAAALQLARADALTPWPWVELPLTDGQNSAVLRVQTDVLAIGTFEDHVRLPLTPGAGQSIFNLFGWLYPTPWIVYQMWRAAPLKMPPTPSVPNLGANLHQYMSHSQVIDQQLRDAGAAPNDPRLRGGIKKHIVVSNIAKPGKVLIFGWYRPPPAPDVFDDGRPMVTPDRQPIQPRSNVHGDFYADYAHGEQAIDGMSTVNGQPMPTADLYQHPTLSKLVSNEGPVRVPRYPSAVQPAASRPVHGSTFRAAIDVVPNLPADADPGLEALIRRRG